MAHKRPHVSTVGLVTLAFTTPRAGGSGSCAWFSPDDLGALGAVASAPARPGLANQPTPQPGPQGPAEAALWPASKQDHRDVVSMSRRCVLVAGSRR